jgi:flagellar motor switch protein FliM
MPTLEMVNEHFTRYFRVSLFNFLRRSAEISVSGIKIQKFSEYVQGLFVPTNLNIIRFKSLRQCQYVMRNILIPIEIFLSTLLISILSCFVEI